MSTTTPKTEIPTPAELVQRAEALKPLLEQHAASTDRERRVPEEVVDAIAAAGLYKLALPRRFGGYQVPWETYLDVHAKLGEACGSTSWAVNINNICNWLAALFCDQAQQEAFGTHPSPRACGVLAPSAQSRRVEGGLRVSGRWGYASGCLHAQWAVLGVPVVNDQGEQIDEGLALIPMDELQIEDTWFVAGMRGTASNTLIAEDVFVPDYRILSVAAAIDNEYPTEHKDEVMARSSFIPVLALVLAGPQVGMARGVLQYAISKAPRRQIAYTVFERQTDSVAFQLQIAEAAMLAETADLHVRAAARTIDAAAEKGEKLDYPTRSKVRAQAAYAIVQARKAIDTVMTAAGSGSFAEVSPLQRLWRDSNTGGRHAVILPDVNAEVYGKALLGIGYEDNITPLI